MALQNRSIAVQFVLLALAFAVLVGAVGWLGRHGF